jgi:hypothetical protein
MAFSCSRYPSALINRSPQTLRGRSDPNRSRQVWSSPSEPRFARFSICAERSLRSDNELAQTFEPMKGLQEQFAQLSEAFQIHLNCLAGSLQPARQFQLELLELARVFDSVADLQAQFTQLAETFKSTPTADGNDARPVPASVQH